MSFVDRYTKACGAEMPAYTEHQLCQIVNFVLQPESINELKEYYEFCGSIFSGNAGLPDHIHVLILDRLVASGVLCASKVDAELSLLDLGNES